jgi:hypothetical protein
MSSLTNLLKDHQIGTWCKRAAWIVLVIGLVEIALDIYALSQQYGYGSPPFTLSELAQVVRFGIAVLPSILFYFFILYAAGALVNHFVAGMEEESDTDEEDEGEGDETEDEEVMPGQMR